MERKDFFENLKKGDIVEVQFKRWHGVDYSPPITNKYTVINPKITKVPKGTDYIQGILFEYDERLQQNWIKTRNLTALSVNDVII